MTADPSLLTAEIETRLNAQLSIPVGVAVSSSTTAPRVVIYPDGDDDIIDKLDTPGVASTFEWRIMSIGFDVAGVEHTQFLVRSALEGWRPSVAGYTLGQVSLAGGRGVRRDDTITDQDDPTYTGLDIFSLLAWVNW